MNPIATATGLGFAYGGTPRQVLRDVDVELAAGEFVLVTGASGSGKSTLLRCFNGLIPHFHGGAFAGRVVVGGLDTRTHQPRDLAAVAGMVFQEPEAQTVACTVQEEIAFGLENQGSPSIVIRKRLEESLDAMGIAHLRGREMRTLSGGEQQRVAIAAVLTMQPSLILMDEPTSQLDPQAADDVLRMAGDLRDDHGLTVLISEHRLERVAVHADRVLHVRGDGSVDSLEPRTAMEGMAGAPPVTRIARALGWLPRPLSLAEARTFVNGNAQHRTEARPPAAATGEVVASCRALDVELGGRLILRIDAIDLREGERVTVMGRNGSGKTTLLRALAGLQPPVRAELTGLTTLEPKQRFREIAYVPQDPAAALFMSTVAAEIRDVLDGTGRGGDVATALSEWNLEAFADKDPRDLSVGERQRTALAALLVGKPRLILLDEPTRGMDANAKDVLLANLRRRASDGACVVLASHDVEMAAAFATRVVLLADGEVVADEPARAALTGSVTFSTQANKLLGGDILTVEESIALLKGERT